MSYSKISISNLALATLGADSIRSFDDKNKRARMCDNFYDATRDYLLVKFDWPFARVFTELQQLDSDTVETPNGFYAYQLPPDCVAPRDIHPLGSYTQWRIEGDRLITKLTKVQLYYTKSETNPALFSATFVNLLALGMAVRLSGPITQDKNLMKSLYDQYGIETANCEEADANVGNDYRAHDEDPNNDTFVNPEAGIIPTEPSGA